MIINDFVAVLQARSFAGYVSGNETHLHLKYVLYKGVKINLESIE